MPKKLIPLILVAPLILAGLIMLNFYPQTKKMATTFRLQASSTKVNVGDKITLSICAAGENIDKISAFDIKLIYDKDKLNLVSASQGSFFNKYLDIKWDKDSAWFAAVVNPEAKDLTPNSGSPLLTAEFIALRPASLTQITTASQSVFYISNSGGLYPESQSVTLIVK